MSDDHRCKSVILFVEVSVLSCGFFPPPYLVIYKLYLYLPVLDE